ncbi:MAG: LLM class flavin-dependent oxidoreductase [Anaerolineae bacterium]
MSESENSSFQIGLYTFGELIADPTTGQRISPQQRLSEVLAMAKLADEAGLAVFGVGEHHRLDFTIATPPVVLAAIAQVTKRIRLTSAVTILSTLDPVHVFEDFATVDLLSAGRAELIVGRGAFIESFPLFGYNVADYDQLFPEKLNLLLKLNASERITWQGKFRTPLEDAEIAPRPVQPQLPIWVGVGGTPESAVRAGKLGLPMALAIIGGTAAQFVPLVDLYRRAGKQAGHDASKLKVGVTSHFHVSKTSQQAMSEFYPYYTHYFGQIAKGRGWTINPPMYQQ